MSSLNQTIPIKYSHFKNDKEVQHSNKLDIEVSCLKYKIITNLLKSKL